LIHFYKSCRWWRGVFGGDLESQTNADDVNRSAEP